MINHPQQNRQNNLDISRRDRIDRILAHPNLINDWETKFLKSVKNRCYLSVVQEDILQALLTRCEQDINIFESEKKRRAEEKRQSDLEFDIWMKELLASDGLEYKKQKRVV